MSAQYLAARHLFRHSIFLGQLSTCTLQQSIALSFVYVFVFVVVNVFLSLPLTHLAFVSELFAKKIDCPASFVSVRRACPRFLQMKDSTYLQNLTCKHWKILWHLHLSESLLFHKFLTWIDNSVEEAFVKEASTENANVTSLRNQKPFEKTFVVLEQFKISNSLV